MSLADCFLRAGKIFTQAERDDIAATAKTHVEDGMSVEEAERQAVTDHLKEAQSDLKEVTDEVAKIQGEATKAELKRMGGEAGWAERGGKLIREQEGQEGIIGGTGKVVGRTKWIQNAEWFQRMRQDLGNKGLSDEAQIQNAVDAYLQGDHLNPNAKRTIDWMTKEAQFAIADSPEPGGWDTMSEGEKNAELDAIFGEDTSLEKAGATATSPEVGFSLKGQTAEEARSAAVTQEREAAEARAREAAPPSEDFALTGSNRLADEAVARGQQELAPVQESAAFTQREQPPSSERPYAATPLKELQRLARETEDDAQLRQVEDELNTRSEEKARLRDERLAQARQAKAVEKPVVTAQRATTKESAEAVEMRKTLDDLAAQGFQQNVSSYITGTPAFQAWFGNSKVVDAEGKPLVVYHGTPNEFTEFDIDRLKSRNEGPGLYFTTDKAVAHGYGQPMEVYLSIKKPLTYDAKPFKAALVERLLKRIARLENEATGGDIRDGFLANFGDTYAGGIDGAVREGAKLIVADKSAVDQISGIVGAGVPAEYVLRAVTEITGHDGIVSKGFSNQGEASNTIYVAFRPEQIKSAIGNRGTFDPSKRNILQQQKPAYDAGDAYSIPQTRPATPEQKSLGVAALRALFSGDRRAGATLLGSALWQDFKERAGSELIGKQVGSPQELALAAQILRDPRFETMRVFFTNGDKIVGHTGWTSRLPGAVAFSMDAQGGPARRINNLRYQMTQAGADGYYLMHNHPSGRATPSGNDVMITHMVSEQMPGFKGHVIIDHNEFGLITNDKTVVHKFEGSENQPAELPHDTLGKVINAPGRLAEVGKMLQAPEGYSTLIATNSQGQIQALADIPEHLLLGGSEIKDLRALTRIRRFMDMTGSAGGAFLVAKNPGRFDWLLAKGGLTDAVSFDGGESRASNPDTVRASMARGRSKMVLPMEQMQFGGNEANQDSPIYAVHSNALDSVPAWVKTQSAPMQEALRKAGIWAPKQTLKQRWDTMKQEAGLKILQGTLDQFAPVLRKIGDHPYKLLRMAASADAGLEASLEYGRLKLNSEGALETVKDTKGFLEVLKPLQGEVDRFFSWVAGNRAEGLAAEEREHLFWDVDIAQLKSLNTKTNANDNFVNGMNGEHRPEIYANVLREYNKFSKSILDIAQDAGIINAEKRNLWEKEFYVPFFRQADEEGKVSGPRNLSGMVNQYAFKKLKGGEGALHDLLANTMQNWSHLLNASLKNRAAVVTLEEAAKLGIARELNSEEKGSVYALKNGEKIHYLVTDPLVLDAISSLGSSPFQGQIMVALGKMKHLLTVGTTMSPVFRVRHTIREQITALAANPTTYNFVKNWIDGFKYSSKNNPEYGNMLAGGAFFRMGMSLHDQNAEYLKRLIAHGVDVETVLDTPDKVSQALKGAWDWWKETGERSDSITRANIYRQTHARLMAEGVSSDKAHFEAAYAARDVMDYGLRGTWPALRMVTQVVPFMNARMQGLYKLGRGAAADPRRFSAVIGGITFATIALSLAYRGDKDWEEREEWDRDNNWWFKIGDKALRIPKPFEVGAIATIVDRALETALNGFDPESRERFAKRLVVIAGSQLNLNPIPQAIFPALELWANKDVFTGRSIESERDRNLTTSQRIGSSTTPFARLVGKAGILSPEQLDFLVNAYFGWVGAHVVATADLALRPMMGMPSQPTQRVDDYFLLGDFVKAMPANQSRFVEQFYDHLKTTQEAFGDMRAQQAAGQGQAAADAAGNVEVQLAFAYRRAATSIAHVNQQVRKIQASDIGEDQKRQQIDKLYQLRNAIARSVETARSVKLQ